MIEVSEKRTDKSQWWLTVNVASAIVWKIKVIVITQKRAWENIVPPGPRLR